MDSNVAEAYHKIIDDYVEDIEKIMKKIEPHLEEEEHSSLETIGQFYFKILRTFADHPNPLIFFTLFDSLMIPEE